MTYTEAQLKVHGELILQYIKNPNLKINKFHKGVWRRVVNPSFIPGFQYEVAELLYQNSLGEEIYEGSEIWYMDFVRGEIKCDVARKGMTLHSTKFLSEASLTEKNVETLALQNLLTIYQSQFK